ncbi:hypothetical protein [Shewanella sp. 6_MG-2023]|uniref:hypothetical protein n=1 Tax=Shewanella sp. 6_MG-2023 TaxID=3062660 RepID=UPI0026E1F844|nr:hypothetical protein [Shewanella sp. 6_MG-2023]MDO6617624.1 hypothetical protein [Shewanella sp. 6_MG-2023]
MAIKTQSTAMSKEVVNILRDTAVQLETKNLLLARSIMEMAKLGRPDGPFITQRLDEYNELLASTDALPSKNIQVVFSYPRSGSTFLLRELAGYSNISIAMEPFHQFENVRHKQIDTFLKSSSELSEFDRQNFTHQLVTHAREDVSLYLKVIDSSISSENVAFKVFPGHLEKPQLSYLIKHTSKPILLYRNLLHSYISDVIATESNRYANTDTSEIKISFNEKDFVTRSRKILGFMNTVKRKLRLLDINFSTMHYEELAMVSSEKSSEKRDEYLSNKFAVKFEMPSNTHQSLKKQDSRGLAVEKVTNPEKMMACLHRMGLTDLNDNTTKMTERYSRILS